MTLHNYSLKASEFVCNVLSLPNSPSIHTWTAGYDCEPGYLTNIISLIGQLAQKSLVSINPAEVVVLGKITLSTLTRKSF